MTIESRTIAVLQWLSLGHYSLQYPNHLLTHGASSIRGSRQYVSQVFHLPAHNRLYILQTHVQIASLLRLVLS